MLRRLEAGAPDHAGFGRALATADIAADIVELEGTTEVALAVQENRAAFDLDPCEQHACAEARNARPRALLYPTAGQRRLGRRHVRLDCAHVDGHGDAVTERAIRPRLGAMD